MTHLDIAPRQATIVLTSMEQVAGRGHDHVRAFGYREADLMLRVVEVTLTLDEALDIIHNRRLTDPLPRVVVPENRWSYHLVGGAIPPLVVFKQESE